MVRRPFLAEMDRSQLQVVELEAVLQAALLALLEAARQAGLLALLEAALPAQAGLQALLEVALPA